MWFSEPQHEASANKCGLAQLCIFFPINRFSTLWGQAEASKHAFGQFPEKKQLLQESELFNFIWFGRGKKKKKKEPLKKTPKQPSFRRSFVDTGAPAAQATSKVTNRPSSRGVLFADRGFLVPAALEYCECIHATTTGKSRLINSAETEVNGRAIIAWKQSGSYRTFFWEKRGRRRWQYPNSLLLPTPPTRTLRKGPQRQEPAARSHKETRKERQKTGVKIML